MIVEFQSRSCTPKVFLCEVRHRSGILQYEVDVSSVLELDSLYTLLGTYSSYRPLSLRCHPQYPLVSEWTGEVRTTTVTSQVLDLK